MQKFNTLKSIPAYLPIINVDTDIGLLIESLFILPAVLIFFYFIVQNNVNDFDISYPYKHVKLRHPYPNFN